MRWPYAVNSSAMLCRPFLVCYGYVAQTAHRAVTGPLPDELPDRYVENLRQFQSDLLTDGSSAFFHI